MSTTDVDTLAEMGFSRNRAQRALATTRYKGVQVAMDWLFAHTDDPDINEPFQEAEGHKLGESSTDDKRMGAQEDDKEGADCMDSSNSPAVAKSLKCEDCGKLIKSSMDVEIHAARTGHQKFTESVEEIKPLTEEEKKEQMTRLQEKIKQRQNEKIEQEKQEALDKEKLRRKQGKQMTNMKQQMEFDEIKKLAEYKKREKLEDKLAKQRVRDQIARDKADRAAKYGKTSSSVTVSESSTSSTQPTAVSSQQLTAAPIVKKDYNQARLQIRLTDGSSLTQTFDAQESLAAVRVFVEMNRTDGNCPFTFMTSFPKKIFTSEEMETPIKELGLVPSAVLLTKPL